MTVALTATAAAAKNKTDAVQPPPPNFARLVACQKISDSTQRLACYDREVATVSTANAKGDLVVMDRQQIRETRRSLFGLTLPNLGLFGDKDGENSTLETTIKSIGFAPDGKPIYNLVEGGRWQQLEFKTFIVDPAPGQKVRVRRAALGSYLMNVNGEIAVRVQRVN
ncbi:MAG: hypothetical protein ACJ8EH_01845 [Sphingomicrobium sp.]